MSENAATDQGNLFTAMIIALNITSAVSIVVVNKKLFGDDIGFAFPNWLMALHLAGTTVGMEILRQCGMFTLPEQRPSLREIFNIGGWQVGSIVFLNYSLLYNTVGQYQILKLVNVPVVCLLEYFWKQVTYPAKILMSLALLCSGIGLTTAANLDVSRWGLMFGALAALTSGVMHISVKGMSSSGLSPQQSCYYVSPVSGLLFTIVAFTFDDTRALLKFHVTPTSVALLVASAACAFCINLSMFLIVGRTSPVTYQVVGHLKTLLVLISGVIFFANPVSFKSIVGMAVAMVGVVWYSYLRTKPADPAAECQTVKVDEPDTAPQKDSKTNSPSESALSFHTATSSRDIKVAVNAREDSSDCSSK
eukprot:TRINITY_DN8025_c0_g1_i3.p1 TRINITY_DN8025_c0_g1~~TRINITY_DN8025_c0_g1_i3.p1  ORF type:complete len:363 (+),score=123.56 TRINITY_DN8025_c0_g1_i3:308-1396(+)